MLFRSSVAYESSLMQGENPAPRVVGAALGTYAGDIVGKQVMRQVGAAAVASAINGNLRTAETLAITAQSVKAVVPSVVQEYVGKSVDKLVE